MHLFYSRKFTLLEVMITLALIVTVSSCFIPLGYKVYQYEKSKQVRVTLGQELQLIHELSLSYGEIFMIHVTSSDYWFETEGYLPKLKKFIHTKRSLKPLKGIKQKTVVNKNKLSNLVVAQ